MAAAPGDAPPDVLRLAGHPVRWRLLHELAGSDRRVGELCDLTGERQSLVSYHLAEALTARMSDGAIRAAGLLSGEAAQVLRLLVGDVDPARPHHGHGERVQRLRVAPRARGPGR